MKIPLTAIGLAFLAGTASAQGEIDRAQLAAVIGDVDVEQAEAIGGSEIGSDVMVIAQGEPVDGGPASGGTVDSAIDAEQAEVIDGTDAMGAPQAGGNRIGYVWANDPSSASYTPSATYSFNDSGGPITITRSSAGNYAVRLAGLGGPQAGGNVQVSGYGPDSSDCKVRHWSSGGADFVATIRCLSPNGAPVDARYTVLVTRGS